MEKSGVFKKIHALARLIPEGRVACYGQLARVAGLPRGARMAGWAMMAEPEGAPVPAHRVIHADGTLCVGSDWAHIQRRLLLEEGIPFDDKGRVRLRECQMDDIELMLLAGEGPL